MDITSVFLGAALLLQIPLAPPEKPSVLPFHVSIGGQAAVVKDAKAKFATIEKPVAADAALEVGVSGKLIIVNLNPADEKGVPAGTSTPAVILMQDTNKTTLDQTMDKKKLTRGHYLMAVVVDGKTSIVFLKVQ